MEKKQRTNTIESSPPSPQEAAAILDPLVQSINDEEGEPIYLHRQSSIFYVPTTTNNETKNSCQRCLTYFERFEGIFYCLVASFLFTCSNFALKQFNVVLFDVLIVRYFLQGVMSLIFILYKGYRPWASQNQFLLFIRSCFAAGGSFCFYFGLTLLPLPDLTTIRYTQVIWTAVLAVIFFRDRIHLPTIFACVLTLVGVICVAQPTFLFGQRMAETANVVPNQRILGMILALSCAISISMSIILNKILIQRQVRQSIIMFYFLCTVLTAYSCYQIYYWHFSKSRPVKPQFVEILLTKDFLFASTIAVLQIFPMVLAQKAIKREHPSIVTVVQSSDIIFAIILQNIFTVVKSNFLVLIGSALVITSIFIVGGHKLWIDRRNRTCLPTNA